MTVDELITVLQGLSASGHGSLPVVSGQSDWYANYMYDIVAGAEVRPTIENNWQDVKCVKGDSYVRIVMRTDALSNDEMYRLSRGGLSLD